MHHPFESIRSSVRDRLTPPFIGLSLLLLFILNLVGQPLVTPAAPYGMISFELARDVDQAQAVLDSWDRIAQLRAAFSLGLDYLFIPLYAITLTLTCLWAARFRRERRRLPTLLVTIGLPGTLLAWAQSLAAGLDAIENVALVRMLFGGVTSPWPQIASICAAVKFSLLAVGIIYSLLALAAYIGAAIFHRQRVRT
jgi:hypothetical protein